MSTNTRLQFCRGHRVVYARMVCAPPFKQEQRLMLSVIESNGSLSWKHCHMEKMQNSTHDRDVI